MVLGVALLLLTAASVQAHQLSGTVYCEAKCPQATVRLFPLGEKNMASPHQPGKPLRTVEVMPATAFTLEVESLPVRVEVSAPGHAAGVIEVWFPEQVTLPPLWLPKAVTRSVQITSAGSKGKLLVMDQEEGDRVGRWRWSTPTTFAEAGKTVNVPVAPGVFTSLTVVEESGCFAFVNVTEGRQAPVSLRCRTVTVTVQDPQGKPQANVRVAAEGMPVGTAALTGPDGKARLSLPDWWKGRVVAWTGEQGGSARVSGEAAKIVLRPVAYLPLVTAQTYPTLLVFPRYIPSALTGGPLLLSGTGGRVPFIAPGGEMEILAYGYDATSLSVESPTQTLGVRLSPQAWIVGKVVDPRGLPAPGVPVWSEESEVATFRFTRFRTATRLLPEPAWVTGQDGSFGPFAVSAGELRLLASHPVLGRADSGKLGPKPKERLPVTLTLAPGTSLSLRVVDERGTPIPGAEVQVHPGREEGPRLSIRLGASDKPALARGESDREGRVILGNLPAGPLELVVKKAGFVTAVQDVKLPPEGKDLGDVALQSGTTITGRVVDEQGRGVPDVRVLAGAAAEMPFEYTAQTEADGHFELADVPSQGILYVQARAREYSSLPVKVSLPPAGPVELKVKAGKLLKGRVVDKETGEAVPNAEISGGRLLTRSIGGFTVQSAVPVPPTSSDQDGYFELAITEPGEVRLEVRAAGFAPAQKTVPIKQDEPTGFILVRLELGFTLRGRVWEADGSPAVGVTVTANEAGERSAGPMLATFRRPLGTTTDGQGQFVLTGLKPGKFTVEARSPEGGQDRVTLDISGDTETQLHLAAPGSLEVHVVGPQGEPLAGARVAASGIGDDLPERQTDAAGVARFEDVAPGMYFVTASLEGYAADSEQVNVGAQGPKTVTLKLARGGEVLGVVRGLSPQELARCQAWVGMSRTKVAGDGSFHLKGVPLGKQELVVSVFPLGRTRRLTVEVPEGSPAQVEVDFSQGVTISGTVRRGSQPVVGYAVMASGPSPMDRASDTTDEGGSFTLSGLSPGKWTLVVSDPNGQGLLTREVEAQKDVQVSLLLPNGSLSGWVRNRTNREPVAEAQITLEMPGQTAFLRRTSGDETGRFTFRELPTGQEFRVRASAPGFAPAETSVTVRESTPEVELLLEPQQTLELVVRDADGSIPTEAFANVQGPSGEPQPVFVSLDREGRGIVTQLPPGDYVALIQGQGAAVVRFAVPSKVQLQLKPRGTLVLESGSPVEVQVLTAEGLPVPWGWRGMGTSGGWRRVETSWRLALPAGDYRLLVRRDGQVQDKAVTVVPGQETVLDLAP